MNLKSCEEVRNILKGGNYTDALTAYCELVNEARNYIMDVSTVDDPNVLFDLIQKQKLVLKRMERMYNEAFSGSQVVEEGLDTKLGDLYDALTEYEQFITKLGLNKSLNTAEVSKIE